MGDCDHAPAARLPGPPFNTLHQEILDDKMCFFCDESGLLKELSFNPIGTLLYGGIIVGTIIISKNDYVDGEMDVVTLDEDEIDLLMHNLKELVEAVSVVDIK